MWLRLANEADVPALVALINDAYKPIDWWLFGRLRTSEDDYRNETGKTGAHTIVAEIAGAIVAHAVLWLQEDGAWIGLFATARDRQGRGIGTIVMEEAEHRARAAGFTRLQLDCVRENGLQAYYESLGFAVEREEHGRMRDATADWTRVYMAKVLR